MKIKIVLGVLILLAAFLRVFRLMNYPIQLGHDEISQLYDAISIAETGRDIYGNFMPTMFVSVHDYKSPFYTYATSIVYLIFGNHEWIIKVPGVLFSILTVPAVYFFVQKFFRNRKSAFMAAALTAVAPFEIFYGRKSFENTIGIFFLLVGFGFLKEYLDNNDFKKFIIGLGTLAFGMYTYFSHAIIIPILLFTFLLINKNVAIKRWKEILLGLFVWGVLVVPLFCVVATNPGSRYRSETVFITQDPELGSKIIDKEGPQRIVTIGNYAWDRYLTQFSFEYLFLNGLDLTNQGPMGVGPLMVIQLPFVVLGIAYLIRLKNHRNEKLFVLSWILIGMIPSGLTFEKFSPHRSIMVFTMLDIISAFGLYRLIILMKGKIRYLVYPALLLLFLFNFVYFWDIYAFSYPVEKAQEIHYPFKQVALFAKENKKGVNQIIFDPKFGEIAPRIGTAAHYYIAYYGDIPVLDFQKEYRLGDESKREVLFDKYSIRAINWAQDSYLKNVILIASPWVIDINGIDKTKIIKVFYYPDKSVAFYAVKL